MRAQPTRPVILYHGGKWRIAPWIIGHFPPHRVYVEPFGGAASVLLRKPRSLAEIYNDLDDDMVNLFRVLQDEPRAARLIKLLYMTPFARAEFNLAYEPTDDPIERARRLIIRASMGFGSNGHNVAVRTGFRAKADRSPCQDWENYPECLRAIVTRVRGVVIENRPAANIMVQHDAPETLHYVDPPYLHSVRSKNGRKCVINHHEYAHEMSDADHAALAECLRGLVGMVVLSGYPSDLYDCDLYADWCRVEREAMADGARTRTEVLWLNPAAHTALERERAGGPLFEQGR